MPSLFTLFDQLKDLIDALGYFGVFILTFLESVFPPIPSELVMGFSGFLVSEGRFTWWGVIIAAVLGNACSSALVWYLGHKYGENFILKYGKWIDYSKEDLEKSRVLFAKYGYFIIFIAQLTPLIRSLISIPAGTLKTKFWPFILSTVAGATIWLSFLTYLGYTLGSNWNTIKKVLSPFEILGWVILVVIVGYFGWRVVRGLRKEI